MPGLDVRAVRRERAIEDIGSALCHAHDQGIVHGDVKPGVVVKQARSEAAVIDSMDPTDPTLAQSRTLLHGMFMQYARAIAARIHGGNAGVPMGDAYRLANSVHDLLAGAQPALAARGCDPAPLLK